MFEEIEKKSDKSDNLLHAAEEKLKFADYLFHRGSDEFFPGAMRHLLEAANKAVSLHLDLKGTNINHLLISKKLSGGCAEEKDFASFYLQLWKLAIKPNLTQQECLSALTKVKAFVRYVKDKQLGF